ncbi:hypothetical protein [Burkholderia sp. BCC0397]|uniref:hypothetical protein n=1 Tax=Burkholderia sp. BCC0397 TaxID=486876 RepID=UPI00158A4168|nr:hypothetical protein [Burkholderia sp. BCC0397]
MKNKKTISKIIKLASLSAISVSLIEVLLFMQCDEIGGIFKSVAQISTLLLLTYPIALAGSLIYTTISYFNLFKQESSGQEVAPRRLAMPYLILFVVVICISRLISISVCTK